MLVQNKIPNAIAAIRVSTTKQGTEGDSPEAQREQINRFAATRGIKIKEIFLFLESASKEEQPMQQAINYCIDPKNKIDIFVIKSIDRFTRGGSYVYSNLKLQLDKCNVRLMDIYGIIGAQKVNTLEHLGVSYKWSVYEPTKNSEMLEAERASDEKRDIMSRMIGAEVRYARMGYHMRRPPLGFISQTVETINGSRQILMPDPKSSPWIIAMFELKARRTLSNAQITDKINEMGYKSKTMILRDKKNRLKIIDQRGGNKLNVKDLDRYIKNLLYAGLICEKWTWNKPIKARFNGLVSIETFNKANWDNIEIVQNGREYEIHNLKLKHEQVEKPTSITYPFKAIIACPVCGSGFLGSASRGQLGKHYPAYHCSHHGHYLRIPKDKFEQSIYDFVSHIDIKPKYVDKIIEYIVAEWNRRKEQNLASIQAMHDEIKRLETNIRIIASNMKYMRSSISISYAEDEMAAFESEIEIVKENINYYEDKIIPSDNEIIEKVREIVENVTDLISNRDWDHHIRAMYFTLLFEKVPSYYDITEHNPDVLCDIFKYSKS